jgi:TonB-linked SusC/RagA family outer membrane protein
MKKTNIYEEDWYVHQVKKLFRIMKLTCLLLLVALVQVSASTYAQSTKLTLDLKNATLLELFEEIESTSEFRFFYDSNEIDLTKKVSVKVDKSKIEEILLNVFEETSYDYELIDRHVIIKNLEANKTVLTLNGQQKSISGKVTDSSNQPLPGVTVVLKGTTTGTVTNIDGYYSISDVEEGTTLVFSFVGMLKQEIVVGTQTKIDITMQADAIGIEEVVAIGYGTQKRATLTGSISSVKGEEIAASPSANVSNSLAGRLPGLAVSQRSGEPGKDDPEMFIRGKGTTGDNTILIIIDGVAREGMSRLNPDDIESFTVLKDASAAIYGARAANGVMLITTKKGKLGKPVFDFSYNRAYNRPTKTWDILDAPLFAQVMNEGAWYRAGRPDDWTPEFSDEDIAIIAAGTDPILHPNTDWIKETLKPWAIQNRTNFSVRGGTEKVKYFVSFSALGQDGNYYHNPTQYNQYNIRSNIELNLNEDLTVGFNMSGRYDKGTYTPDGAWLNHVNILLADPTIVAQYPNGLIAGGRAGQNPLLNDQMGEQNYESTPIFTTFSAEYKVPFVEGLKVSGTFNYDVENSFTKTFKTPYTYWTYDTSTEDYIETDGSIDIVSLEDYYEKSTGLLYNFKVDYSKKINDHAIAVMAGTEQQQNNYNWAKAYNQNFLSTAISQINVGSSSAEDQTAEGSATETAYVTYFGRLNYNYKEKYLFEFIARYDGSQNFPEDTRYGFFPGVSAAWRLSEEDFIQENMPYVDNLKLRGSYGEIGNDRVDAYQYLQAYEFSDNYVFGAADASGLSAGTMPNPNITWEVSKKTDIGLEAGLWNGLLGFDLTLFWENRSNILEQRNVSVSKVFGFTSLPDENIGEVENNGYELILTHHNKVRDFSYNVNANMAFAKNKVIFIDEISYPEGEEYRAATGMPIGAALYYHADGIINDQAELDEYLPLLASAQLGDTKIMDLNGDGTISANDQARSNLTTTPEYTFGLSFDCQYKNFDFTMFWQGAANVEHYDYRFMRIGRNNRENGFTARAKDRWTVDNPYGTMPRADDGAFNMRNNTLFVFDASYLRLKTIELGYSMPQEWMSKAGLSQVRFYCSGFNLLTFTKQDFIDPEADGQFVYYPQQKTLNFGVNVKF